MKCEFCDKEATEKVLFTHYCDEHNPYVPVMRTSRERMLQRDNRHWYEIALRDKEETFHTSG